MRQTLSRFVCLFVSVVDAEKSKAVFFVLFSKLVGLVPLARVRLQTDIPISD